MAPSAIASGQPRPGTRACATTATAAALARTSPTASEATVGNSVRRERIDVKKAATYTIGGTNTMRTTSPSISICGSPGTSPSANPPTRRTIG